MKKGMITTAFLLYFAFFSAAIVACGILRKSNTPPEQPIAFSHKKHIAQGMKCVECHTKVETTARAWVPSVQKCMSCHNKVKTDSPEVQKIHEAWNNKEPIIWAKVHYIREEARVGFRHDRHIKKGIDCTACHGDVMEMETARRVSSLDMGWCVKCHTKEEASIDCLTCHK